MIDITVGTDWFAGENKAVVDEVVAGQVGFTLHFTDGTAHKRTTNTTVFLNTYKQDMVNNPPHYKDASGVGCTEVVKHMMYFGGACFKYLYRCGNKWDDIGDLKKAVRCAELADDDRFITDESWLRAMYQVASHRDGNIREAMFSIRSQQWEYVIESIKAEIARLESEAADE